MDKLNQDFNRLVEEFEATFTKDGEITGDIIKVGYDILEQLDKVMEELELTRGDIKHLIKTHKISKELKEYYNG